MPAPAYVTTLLATDTLTTGVLAADEAPSLFDGMLVPLAIVFLIFYFLVIRPSSKEKKEREQKLKALKKHDKVVTNAGIHGTVMSVDGDTMILRVDDKNNVRMKFSRAAVWQVLTPGGDGGETSA
jgi:preprotein translocase subunit YajC